ncbi:uncharacterized protein UHOR_07112 [Ustilago hordei]|uniref:Zn(2)-C6 fungal-type domain-containing protein n=1 Tax=Ustilago hordei TaxID=120017 RepID=I2FT83_USTHO|nr:uncharacterized protein UHOR_07112 [Ustilago hordei]
MKRKRNEAPSASDSSRAKISRRQSKSHKLRSSANASLPRQQQVKSREHLNACSTGLKPSSDVVPDTATKKSSKSARARALIAPTLRFSPFLDVVIRRASPDTANVIEDRISRDAIHLHPTNPDLLLVTPTCVQCKKLKRSCNRAGWTCSSCAASRLPCSRASPWDFYDAITGKKVRHKQDTQHPVLERNDKLQQNREVGNPKIRCFFWASSIDEMRHCDPQCPSIGDPTGTSKLGAITALLLDRAKVHGSSEPERLVADISADATMFERLQMASIAATPLRIYHLFGDLGRPCRVVDNSVATVKIFFVGVCTISRIARQNGSLTEISLTLNTTRMRNHAGKPSTSATSSAASLLPLNDLKHTFLGFRCSNKDAAKLLPSGRKMELSFTGSRSDLGHANILLSNDDLTERTVSTFSDGTRVCMYHIASAAADTACSGTHDLKATTLTLHHVLRPGQPDTPSIEALLSPAAPYRLSLQVEYKFRIRGYALGFGDQAQDLFPSIVNQPFSSASEEFVRQIASLRRSLQIATIANDVNARPGKPLGCILLVLQNGQLKQIDRSLFPAGSSYFGLLCADGLPFATPQSGGVYDCLDEARQTKPTKLFNRKMPLSPEQTYSKQSSWSSLQAVYLFG